MSRKYPDAPRIGVSVLCIKDGHALMIKRGKEPFKDHWSLPGGLVELGETLKEAAKRELMEETGATADIGDPVETFDSIQRDAAGVVSSHFVLTMFRGSYLSGEVCAGDDASEAKWLRPAEIETLLTTPGTSERVRRFLKP